MKSKYEFYRRIKSTDIVEENGTIWMSIMGMNGLVEVDISTWKIKVLCKFEKENNTLYNLYSSIVKVKNKIILIPCAAERIAIYELSTKSMVYLKIRDVQNNRNEIYDKNAKFWKYYVDGDDVYLLGHYYPAIIKINTDTYKTTYLTDWVKELDKCINKGDKRGYIGAGFVKMKNKVYFPLQCYPGFLVLELDTNKVWIKKIKSSLDGIGMMGADDYNIWIEGKGISHGVIAKMDLNMEQIEEIGNIEKTKQTDYSIPFWEPISYGDKIFLFPSSAQFIYEVDKATNFIKKSEINNYLIKNGSSQFSAEMIKKINDKIYFLTTHDRKLHIYNLDSKEVESHFLYLPEGYVVEEIKRICLQKILENKIISEKEVLLEDFMLSEENELNIDKPQNIGKHIYTCIAR